MNFPKQSSRANIRLGSRRGNRKEKKIPLEALVFIAFIVVMACFLMIAVGSSASFSDPASVRKAARKKPIPALGNTPNAVAMDIINSLDCEKEDTGATTNRTRSDDIAMKSDSLDGGDDGHKDFADDGTGYFGGREIKGRDLFCLVAGAQGFTKRFNEVAHNEMHCDATGSKREALLNVWSSARSQMPLDMIQKVLDISVEQTHSLIDQDHFQFIWQPMTDASVEYYVSLLSSEKSSIKGLESLNKKGGIFVDVGSGLGISTLAVSLLYPEATVLSVEPAMPSWLLQRMNLVCNLPSGSKMPHPVMSGVGTTNDGMNKMLWRPSSTGTTRAWTPKSERTEDDIELIIRLRTLRSILAEAAADEDTDVKNQFSVVLNVDCEGCEYNIIPAMQDIEFDAIDTIIGTNGVHWGLIPEDKRPSSERGNKTHKRLCTHSDFAESSIECCEFPDLKLKRPGHPTVKEIKGSSCDNFESWAIEKGLRASTDDYGWVELTSMA